MSEESKRPGTKLGIIGMLLVAIAVVVVGTLAIVLGMCSGYKLSARAPLEKPVGLAVMTIAMLSPLSGDGFVRGWPRLITGAVFVGIAAAGLAYWLA